ncbi:ATP-grasp domain-containing protein [Hymenobacter sp. BT664]|uniref:ATP-grasp domain-containing protein n=1 Tax=Hymenobacter montanus TaxID=2771359 RepID=A0A927GIF2_9BACT|nr:ATP-grasp domain-containing protein [Hymenobacter montanus]MBD2767305.1 ATP-grasp domain-containing protein [Hymenobacter montanus]
MIKRAYIHEYGNNKLEPEHKEVIEVLKARGIQYELFTNKKLSRNQLIIDNETFVVGDNPTIATVLKRIGFHFINDSYPKSLEKYLGRQIWETTIRKLLSQTSFKEVPSLFVKPKSKAKIFTGFIINSDYDLFQLESFSKETDLYCSTVVNWLSEYRVFVNNSEIVGVKLYAGDETLKLDLTIVQKAINDFENSPGKTAAYGMDFGVLDSGQTTLIEWNDGFSLGSYGLDKEIYTDLLIARWEEILKITSTNKCISKNEQNKD